MSAAALAALALARPAAAQPADMMVMVRADRWAEAETLAAAYPDPVARKLVTFYRLISAGGGTLGEIAAFQAGSPDWPSQSLLQRRRDEALATEPDDGLVLRSCEAQRPRAVPALVRCAQAEARAGRAAAATATLRAAWVALPPDPVAEATFLRGSGAILRQDDQWRRFDRLAWTDAEAAARQAGRLDLDHAGLAAARLALRRDAPNAAALVAALPDPFRADPAIMLEQARWLRRGGQPAAAASLWRLAGGPAQAAVSPERVPAFLSERLSLARELLKMGDAANAAAVIEAQDATEGEQHGEIEFLAGWIALRRLSDPAGATAHFARLAASSGAAITQGRAHYWLGRAAAAAGDLARARTEYATAANWPTTYYGQLAALALIPGIAPLNARITAQAEPGWDDARAIEFSGRELSRAATLLVAWGEPRRARAFLTRLEEITPDPADKALAARLAAGFDLPDQAVAVARQAARDGVMLVRTGWPVPFDPPTDAVEPALALSIVRQESNFDPQAQSPVGARGLMQLMPTTAQVVAKQVGAPVSVPALTTDPAYNLRLGTAYLRVLSAQFAGTLPYAIAAYNAGPGRVLGWVASNGDATGRPDEMIDWIELIPFNETRNYVQRVVENLVIYRALRGETAQHPLGG